MKVVRWADAIVHHDWTELDVDHGPGAVPMAHTLATGTGMLSNGQLGVDRISVGRGHGFVPHTHPGDHILIVIGGRGTISYDGTIYPTVAGQAYMVPGEVAHAVGSRGDHVILAVGSPHKAVDDTERMTPVEYVDVIADATDMTCLACLEERGVEVSAAFPTLLHELGCPHCCCFYCVSTGDPDEDARLLTGLEMQRFYAETAPRPMLA